MITHKSRSISSSDLFHSDEPEHDHNLRKYWERGYILLRGLFDTTEIENWNIECERLLKADFVHQDNVRTPFRFNSGVRPERIDPVVDISPVFKHLVCDPRIVQPVQAIFRDEPYLFKDKLIFKAPGTKGYSIHQDQAWWQMCPADDILSVSIQIDGATVENGCIELFPGNHDRLRTPEGMLTNFRPEEIESFDFSAGQKIETIPGDILIFHSLAPHQSGTNASDTWRRSLYLTYSAARGGDCYERHRKEYVARLMGEAKARQTYYK